MTRLEVPVGFVEKLHADVARLRAERDEARVDIERLRGLIVAMDSYLTGVAVPQPLYGDWNDEIAKAFGGGGA